MKRNVLLGILPLFLLIHGPFVMANNAESNAADEVCMDCFTAPLLFCPSTYFGCPGDNIDPLLTGQPIALPGDLNCPMPEVSYTDTLVTDTPCFKKYHRIWKAQYPAGEADPKLFSQCIQTLILEDDMIPEISNCPMDITIDLFEQCDSTATWSIPTASDNCGISSLSANYAPGDTFPGGQTTVIYIATDNCGLVDSCSFNVIVMGVCCENLTLACPQDTTACVNSVLDPIETGFATVDMPDSTCIDPLIFYSDSIIGNNPECLNGVIVERTWFASDSNQINIYASCTQLITTQDTIAPVIDSLPSDITVLALGANCTAIAEWDEPVAVDSCGIFAFSSNIPSGSSFPEGVSTVSYAAVDFCGNTALASFTVTVECDTSCLVPPVISCPADVVLCPSDSIPLPDQTGWATAVPGDSTCLTPIISYSDSITSTGSCAGTMTVERTWIAADPDNSELADTCIQLMVFEDNTAPTINNIPPNITITADAVNCLVPVSWILPDATDNCGIQSFDSNLPSGSLLSEGTTLIVYTAIDNCGLIATAGFTVTIECAASCSTGPVVNCPADYWACPDGSIPSPSESGYATAYPGSTDCEQPILTYNDVIVSTGPCALSKIVERHWTATDPNNSNLSTTCVQTLSLEDFQAPTILYCPTDITVNATSSGSSCSAPVSWNAPLATDNCGAPNLSSADAWGDPINNGQVFDYGVTTVIYTAEDLCGNTTECSFTVTVICSAACNQPPVLSCPSNKVICPGASPLPSITGWATASAPSSSCPQPSLSYTDLVLSTGPCFGEKYISRTWTANYNSGSNLSSSCVQTIQLKDDIAPVFSYCPADITVYDSSQAVYWNTPLAYDNCGSVSLSSNYSPGTYFPAGTTTVTYWAEDNCWNGSSCSFTVTVQNQYNIELVCPSDLFLTCNSSTGAVANWSAPTFNGACNSCETGDYIPGFVYMGSLNGSQYYCSTTTATWPQAQANCVSKGGHLASINSQEENDFLADILSLQSAWIGLSDANNEGAFEWANGDALNYTNWYPGQPNNYNNNQDYVEMMNDGLWNDQYNYYSLEYIMEIPCSYIQQVSGPSPGSTLTGGNYTVSYEVADGCGGFGSCSFDIYVDGGLELTCPADQTITTSPGSTTVVADWEEPLVSTCCNNCNNQNTQSIQGFVYMGSLNGHDYYCSTFTTSWEQARSVCEGNGGYLAVINDAQENAYLANLLNLQSAWIGLSDTNIEGTFEWTDGSPLVYQNWYAGQPNNYNNNQDYVEMLNDGQWNDQYNYYSLEFIMEIPSCIDVIQTSGPAKGSTLQAGSQYQVTYQATDACGNIETCSFNIDVIDGSAPQDYCESEGDFSHDFYIASVKFGNLTNDSGDDGGYGDYTDLGCENIIQGSSYNISLTPSVNQQDRIYWRVWIDLNLDGDFYDPYELVAYGSGISTVSGLVSLPAALWSGEARMRIIMNPGNYPADPCGNYPLGETEDYCLTVLGTSDLIDISTELETRAQASSPATELQENLGGGDIRIYPNPASDYVRIEASDVHTIENMFLSDAAGRLIKNLNNTFINAQSEINVADIESGIYFIHIEKKNLSKEVYKLIVSH